MKYRYTPGPWRISEGSRTRVISRIHRVIADCGHSTSDLDLGNAQLIAAAPELLEELRAIRDTIEKRTETPLADLVDFHLEQILRLIQKAEGG